MSAEISKELFIAQYEKLREEILHRVERRQDLLTYTLVGAASFLSVGLQSWASGVTVLCYPILAFFLACAWGQHDSRIGQINLYLRSIEDRYLEALGPGWETYRRITFIKKRPSLSDMVSLPARGLFIGSSFLALIIGLARFAQDPQMLALFVLLVLIDGLMMLLMILVLKHRRLRVVEEVQPS